MSSSGVKPNSENLLFRKLGPVHTATPRWREGGGGLGVSDDVSIQAAIEANDAFIERLEAIRDAAQRPTIEQ